MKSKGLVYEMRRYIGEGTPPLTVLEDASRYGSDGAFQASGHPAWVKNPAGIWELDFDSSTPDYVEIPASFTQLDFTSEDFSVIVRFKADDLSTDTVLLHRGLENTDGYYFTITDGRLRMLTAQSGASQSSYTPQGNVSTGEWVTGGFSRAGGSVRVYKNGNDSTDIVGTHINPATCVRSALIGIHYNLSAWPFDGKMVYLAIWRYALAPEEHAAKHQELSRWG